MHENTYLLIYAAENPFMAHYQVAKISISNYILSLQFGSDFWAVLYLVRCALVLEALPRSSYI